jgi:proline iminopeptidase
MSFVSYVFTEPPVKEGIVSQLKQWGDARVDGILLVDVNDASFITADDGVRLYFQKLGHGRKTVVTPNGMYLLNDFERLAAGRTLIAYDPRNRGRSDQSVNGNIHRDVDDLEAERVHFGIDRLDLIGHSYVGLMVALYGMKFPDHVNRIVQIGAMEPAAGKQYPPHLTGDDGTQAAVFAKLGQMYKERQSADEVEFCRKAWAVLGALYVTDPADAGKIDWGRCDLPNERNFMKYWLEKILPSIQSLRIAEEVSKVTSPVLTIHGTRDRNAPYGAGREWAMMLPDARLVTVEGAAHAPWIEGPDQVFGAIESFLSGTWPKGAEKVESVETRK